MFVCSVQDVIRDRPIEPRVPPKHTRGEHVAAVQRRTSHVTMKLTIAGVRIRKARSNVCSAKHTSLCDCDSVTAQSDAAA